MSSILTELWDGNVTPHERFIQYSPEEKKLFCLAEKNRDALYATLTEEQRNTLEKHLDAATELSVFLEQRAFRYGFRLGGQLMMETLTDIDEE